MSLSALTFYPPVIAHRGASALAPENTLAAFRCAHESGALWMEMDVKLTCDGVPVLMHDDGLNRTTNGTGPIAEMNWAEVQKLDAGSWFGPDFAGERVPHLAEILRFVLDHDMRVNLEIKPCPGRARATTMVALIEAAKIWPSHYPPPLVSSFDVEALAVAAQLHPEWPRGLALEEWPEDWNAVFRKTQPAVLTLDKKLFMKEDRHIPAQIGLPVLVYTVNDPVQAQEFLREGVNAVFSDNPKEILEAL